MMMGNKFKNKRMPESKAAGESRAQAVGEYGDATVNKNESNSGAMSGFGALGISALEGGAES